MKQFRCADIVPGCSASIRNPDSSVVVSQALEHLRTAHARADAGLQQQVEARVRSEGLLATLFRRG